LEELGEAEARSKVNKFLSTEGSIVSRPVNPFTPVGGADKGKDGAIATTSSATPTTSQGQSSSASAGSSSSSSTDEVKSKPKLPSFWVPSLTPDAKPTEIKKPVRE
jgi:nitric oxide synthase-interacting protein